MNRAWANHSRATPAALPPAAQSFVERRAKVAGQLRVLHIDRLDGTGEYDMRVVDGSAPVLGQDDPREHLLLVLESEECA